MQTHAEAISPVVAAQKAALLAASGVTTLLSASTHIYEGEAPVPTAGEIPPSYLVIANPAGESNDVFMQVGADVRNTIDIWCDTQAKVLALYTEIAKVIDGPHLALGGSLNHLSGHTRLLTTVRDPGRRRLYHGIVQYAAVVR